MCCYYYNFEDGAYFCLYSSEFSNEELLKMQKLHGKCTYFANKTI